MNRRQLIKAACAVVIPGSVSVKAAKVDDSRAYIYELLITIIETKGEVFLWVPLHERVCHCVTYPQIDTALNVVEQTTPNFNGWKPTFDYYFVGALDRCCVVSHALKIGIVEYIFDANKEETAEFPSYIKKDSLYE